MPITDPGSVKLSYKDVVQLEKSGAGLPSHPREAALYDGAGNQILGRTAVRHWLDPHPDAASFDETWEFSTTGDMTQAALETAGWTFSNCTALVANGLLELTATSSVAVMKASLAVSFSGDFDVVVTPVPRMGYAASASTTFLGGHGVADYRAGTADVAHYVYISQAVGYWGSKKYIDGAFTTLGGTLESDNVYFGPPVTRTLRASGNNYLLSGAVDFMYLLADDTTSVHTRGWTQVTAKSDASTFNKLFLIPSHQAATTGDKFYFANVRRFQ